MSAADLAALCRRLGPDVLRFQGPGGNFSVKDGDRLDVKASGGTLATAAVEGLVATSRAACLAGLPPDRGTAPGPDDEAAYVAAVGGACLVPDGRRPTMELGLHALVTQRFVLHSHSVAGMAAAGAGLPLPLPPGWQRIDVPAVAPGLELTTAVRRRLGDADPSRPALWVLANHGLLWAADDVPALAEAEAAFEATVRSALGLAAYPPPADLDFAAWPDFRLDADPFFPDYAVFFPDADRRPVAVGRRVHLDPAIPEARRDAAAGIVFAQALLSTLAARLGGHPLPPEVATRTAGLEIERLRLRQGAACQ